MARWLSSFLIVGAGAAGLWASASLGALAAREAGSDSLRSRAVAASSFSGSMFAARSSAVGGGTDSGTFRYSEAPMSHRWTAEPANDERTTYADAPRQSEAPPPATGSTAPEATPLPTVPPVGPAREVRR